MQYQKICVIGLGYIGLPTAALLATKGFEVWGVDIRSDVVEKLNRGEIHIVEQDLDVLVKSAVYSGKFTANLKPTPADTFILAVPTPFHEDKTPDMSYVEDATCSIIPFLTENNLIILESTSPVGTTEKIQAVVAKMRPELKKIYFAHCPERVIPGKVLRELVENDRIVGGVDAESTEKAASFYRTFVVGAVLLTDAKTAEMCKLTENAFRDVNIAFANELSLICNKLNINVWELIRMANHHPRVKILQPGSGVGGHCIAVDPWFIVASAPEISPLLRAARQVNDAKPWWVIQQVKKAAQSFKNPVIVCLGVAFKADIDDLRESPSLMIAKHLRDAHIGELLVCEPNIEQLEGFELVSMETAILRADVLVILVDHRPFKKLQKKFLEGKVVIDTRGVLS